MNKKIVISLSIIIFLSLVFINKKIISQAMEQAVHTGNVNILKKEIKSKGAHGINQRYPGRGGRTLLHFACESENTSVAMVKYLVDKGADINQEDFVGTTPLLSACSNPQADLDIVQYLIAKGAKVNDRCITYASNDTIEKYVTITKQTDTDDYRKALRIVGNKIKQRENNYDHLMYPISDAIQRIIYNLPSLHKSIMYNLFYAIKVKQFESAFKEYFSSALKIEKNTLDFDTGFINFLKNILSKHINHPFIDKNHIPKALAKLSPSAQDIIEKIKSDNLTIYRDYVLISIMDAIHNLLKKDNNVTKILKNSVFDNLYNTIAQNGDLQKKATQAFANTLTINPKKIDFTKKMPLVLKDVFHQMRYITPHPLFTDEPHGTAARHAYDKLATFLEKSDQ